MCLSDGHSHPCTLPSPLSHSVPRQHPTHLTGEAQRGEAICPIPPSGEGAASAVGPCTPSPASQAALCQFAKSVMSAELHDEGPPAYNRGF